MDRKEEALQLKKLAGIDKMVVLLEEIAWQGSHQNVPKEDYLRGLYARSQQSAVPLHAGVRTQPAAHEGKLSKCGCGARVHSERS